MRIDRCVCYGTLFTVIISKAKAEGWTMEDIERILGCGSACGMCKPYIREGLRTGETEFNRILREGFSEP